ncbi:MAG: urease accessory protein UreF [Cyanobacteria bacterium P01_F01_bin.150]
MTAHLLPQQPFGTVEALPFLLQLASPALPVGAYSYSEGLEFLVETGTITTDTELESWIRQELSYGAIRIETAVLARMYRAFLIQDLETTGNWNRWLSAMRETKELREQNWQMGQALARLMRSLQPDLVAPLDAIGHPHNFSTVFAVAAVHWKIELEAALLGYLHSWMTNLMNAGIKLIPLGQTAGQNLLVDLYPTLRQTIQQGLELSDDELYSCSWGAAIASMNHETLYSRLFRS